MISAIEGQEAKKMVLTTRMRGSKMLLRYYCLLFSEQGRGDVGLFLLRCIYLREVQQQDHACVCRGRKEESELQAQSGQSVSRRIYLVIPWSRLPSAEQIKIHLPLAGTSSPVPL